MIINKKPSIPLFVEQCIKKHQKFKNISELPSDICLTRPVFRIRDILARIRILGSVSLTIGSGS
jgi:hypothetical protein